MAGCTGLLFESIGPKQMAKFEKGSITASRTHLTHHLSPPSGQCYLLAPQCCQISLDGPQL